MTVPQDTVLCFALGGAGRAALPAALAWEPRCRKIVITAFASSWLPLTSVFLLAWPAWSWWYLPGVEEHLLASWAAGVVVETAAFAAGLAVAARAGPPKTALQWLIGAGLAYLLTVLPWPMYGEIGTAAAKAAGEAVPLYSHMPLLGVLVAGGAWMTGVWGYSLWKLSKLEPPG